MLTAIIIFCFTAAVLFGSLMAWRFYNHQRVGYGLIIPHGSAAFLGTLLLILDLWYENQAFRLYFGYIVLGSLLVTATIGLLLLLMHRKIGQPKPSFVILHIFMAVTALFFLAVYFAPTYTGGS